MACVCVCVCAVTGRMWSGVGEGAARALFGARLAFLAGRCKKTHSPPTHPRHTGWDYGPCEWGHGYRPDKFEAAFQDMAARGATCVRLWVFGDGRAQPTWDARNRDLAVGLDPQFYADFDNMLWRAGRAGFKVMPVLWDFIAMNKPDGKATRGQGMKGKLFTDPDLANAFCENVLRPLVSRYAGNETIIAWDIFNEPEWCVTETGEATTTQKLPLKALQTFIGRCASIIHTDGGAVLATVGSASVKWCWELGPTRPDWCADFWGDAPLVASNNGDPAAFLDFLQTHYYPWMKKEIDPFQNPPSTYADAHRKPVVIGEAQANLIKQYSAPSLAANARAQGYAGLLYWSYEGVDAKGGWDDFAGCVGGECAAPSGGGGGGDGGKSKVERVINRIFGF